MLKVRVLCSVRRSNSAHSSYSLWSLGLLTLWCRPRSRWGFYHLWNSRSHPQTCRCNTIQVSLLLGDFYFENFENAKLEMKSFLGSVCVGVCGVCVRTCLCVAATHCSMSASLSTNTSMSKLSFFPSTTETHKHTDVTDSALSPNIALPYCVYWHFWALGLDWTSRMTVATASAYMSLSGLAIHWGNKSRRNTYLLQWWQNETEISELIGKILDL